MNSKICIVIILLMTLICSLGLLSTAKAQTISDLQLQIDDITQRVDQIETDNFERDFRSRDAADAGALAFLFGAFCALWAQNTGRNAWGWFFLGLIFSVITVIVLLVFNSSDNKFSKTKT